MSNTPTMRVAGAVSRYYDHLKRSATSTARHQINTRRTDPGTGTVETRRQMLDFLVQYCEANGITHLHRLNAEIVDEVLQQRIAKVKPRRGDTAAPNTINNHVGSLRGFFNWCALRKQKYLTADKAEELCTYLSEVAEEDDAPALIVPIEKWAGLFQMAEQRHMVERVYLELGYYLGIRDSEITGLKWETVDLERGYVKVYRDKRNDSKIHRIPTELLATLKAWHEHMMKLFGRVEGSWFVTPAREGRGKYFGRKMFPGWPVSPEERMSRMGGGRIVKPLLKALGYTDAELLGESSHVMRRSRASHLNDAGYNINLIRDMLGHKTIAMTMRYIRRGTDKDLVAEMMDQPVKTAAIVPSQTGFRADDIPPADASKILAHALNQMDGPQREAFMALLMSTPMKLDSGMVA